MDRRFFLTGLVPTLFEPRNEERVSSASPEPLTGVDDAWIEHIKRDDHYQLLKTLARVDLVFLTPPERGGGSLRLDFINWDTYPNDHDDVLLVPAVRVDPEWHVLGPARYSVSLWMGPLPSSRTPSALIHFEAPTHVSIYTHDDRIQQVVLLTGDRQVG